MELKFHDTYKTVPIFYRISPISETIIIFTQATLQSSYQRTSAMLISQWKSKWSHKPSSAPPLHSAPVGAKQSSPPTLNALSWVLSLDSILT